MRIFHNKVLLRFVAILFSLNLFGQDSANLSDPTRPLINTNRVVTNAIEVDPAKQVSPRNQLQAIYYRSKVKKAVIDNQLVSVGEKVNGYTVERIEARQVVLRLGRTLKKLRLSPSIKVINKKG